MRRNRSGTRRWRRYNTVLKVLLLLLLMSQVCSAVAIEVTGGHGVYITTVAALADGHVDNGAATAPLVDDRKDDDDNLGPPADDHAGQNGVIAAAHGDANMGKEIEPSVDAAQPVMATAEAAHAERVDVADVYRMLEAGQLVSMTQQSFITPDTPTVYLSFDDGPSEYTPQVLDLLRDEDVQATFFVLGKLAERSADTLQRIVDEGHAIGNHTYDHRYEILYRDFEHFFEQVTRTDDIIYETTGVRTPLFRAPGGTHGHFDAYYMYYMEQAGYIVYDWNVDSGDARRHNVPAAEIIANVKNAPLRHEMHVLMHDSAGHAETVKALPEIIRYFKQLGYQFAVLDSAVEPKNFTLGKPRYHRKVNWQMHLQYLESAISYRHIRDAARESASQIAEERLVLKLDGREIVLERDEYYSAAGRYHITLCRLLDALSGTGHAAVSIDCADSEQRKGGSAIFASSKAYLAHRYLGDDMRLMILDLARPGPSGEPYVPLRAAIERLGAVIPSYSLDGPTKVIHIHSRFD